MAKQSLGSGNYWIELIIIVAVLFVDIIATAFLASLGVPISIRAAFDIGIGIIVFIAYFVIKFRALKRSKSMIKFH